MIGWILAGLAGAALLSDGNSSGTMVKSSHCECKFCGRTADYEFAGENDSFIRARFRCSCGRVWTKFYEK